MQVKEVVPLLNVTDMQRSVPFYVDGLGFKIESKWEPDGKIRWCMLRLGPAGLMIQQGNPVQPPKGFSLCFFIDDAVALYHDLQSRGVQADEPFVGNRLWVAQVRDPDGYRLDFESPTDVPEETHLSEWKP